MSASEEIQEPNLGPKTPKVTKKKGTQPLIGPSRPKNPVEVFTAKMCKRQQIEPSSKNKNQWRDEFQNLKQAKKMKFIQTAIQVSNRFSIVEI